MAQARYHITRDGVDPLCDVIMDEDDHLVSEREINESDGRWFNCRMCGDIVGIVKHVQPGSVSVPDPAELA